MYCTKCGTSLKAGAKFCTKCGAAVSNETEKAFTPEIQSYEDEGEKTQANKNQYTGDYLFFDNMNIQKRTKLIMISKILVKILGVIAGIILVIDVINIFISDEGFLKLIIYFVRILLDMLPFLIPGIIVSTIYEMLDMKKEQLQEHRTKKEVAVASIATCVLFVMAGLLFMNPSDAEMLNMYQVLMAESAIERILEFLLTFKTSVMLFIAGISVNWYAGKKIFVKEESKEEGRE